MVIKQKKITINLFFFIKLQNKTILLNLLQNSQIRKKKRRKPSDLKIIKKVPLIYLCRN
jgi:hypothetical protein